MFSLVQPRVRWLVSRVTGGMVLDIGFLGTKGAPMVHRAIREGASGRVIGFDIAVGVLTCGEPDSVVGDVQFLPFGAGSFDTVVLGEFVEHFECLRPILTEVRRVLARGGRLVLTTPNPYAWPRWLRHWLLAVSPGRAENVQAFLYVQGHLVLWEPLSLCNLLRMYGLEPLEVTTRHQVVPLLARVLPSLGRLDWRFFPFNRIGLYTCIVACCV